MKIACHYAIPRPPQPQLDAAVQDGLKLIDSLGGEINFLYPGTKARRIIPRFLCGLHQLPHLRRLDRRVDVHQIFSNGIYPYPVLRFLSKPIVYSSVIDIQKEVPPLTRSMLKQVRRFVVVTERDRNRIKQLGFDAEVILPGIDIGRFSCNPLKQNDEFILLYGSAPWNQEQFATKGVDVLLQAAVQLPWLKLIFLWRGKLLQEMRERVSGYGLSERVQVIDKQVHVNAILATVHAGVVLAEKAALVKAYPHSLLESLAAGKPVMISRCLSMSDYVERKHCGVAVEDLDLDTVCGCLQTMRKEYAVLSGTAASLELHCFSDSNLIESYSRLYKKILCDI